jgi:histone acetyltransferase
MHVDVKMQSAVLAGGAHQGENTTAQNGNESGVLQAETALKTGAYMAREEHLIKLEREGEYHFFYVENDGTPQNMIYLISLKNIFSKQLPNMPKEYICRLVLERRHRWGALTGQVWHTACQGPTCRALTPA